MERPYRLSDVFMHPHHMYIAKNEIKVADLSVVPKMPIRFLASSFANLKRSQKLQNAAKSFILCCYANKKEAVTLRICLTISI